MGTSKMKKLNFKNYPFTLNIFKPIYEPFHATNSFDILCVVCGSMKMKTIIRTRILEKGEIEFLNVSELISCEKNSKNLIVALLSIDSEFIKKIIPECNNRLFNCKMNSFFKGISTKENYEELKIKTLSIIAKMFFHSSPVEKDTITAKRLLEFIQNEFEDIKNALKNVDKTFHQDRFIKIDHYLMQNISQQISLNDINNVEFLSKPYLSQEFSRLLNRNFKEILSYYRVIHAAKLLLETKSSISEISLESGFSGTRYFYKYFKKFLDITPNDFRKLHMNRPYEYEEISDEDKESIKNFISGFTIEKKYSETIDIRNWLRNNTDELEKGFSIELNIIAIHLNDNFYFYNLLKTVENISINACRFIFKPSDISKLSIKNMFDILNFSFNNFRTHFRVIVAIDSSDFLDIADDFLDNAIKDIIQTSAKMKYDIHFEILSECENKKKRKELFPKIDTLSKQDLLGKTSAMTPSEFIHHIKNVKNSGINVFLNIMDVSLIGIDPDRTILLFDDQFVMTPYFKIIYMLSLLNGSIVSRNDAVYLTNNYGEYSICTINNTGYSFFLYNSDFDNDKTVEVVIQIPNEEKNQSNHDICTNIEKDAPWILLYNKTNIFIHEKILLKHGSVPSSLSKQNVNVSTNITKAVSEYNKYSLVVALEPGDIIVLNVEKKAYETFINSRHQLKI